MISEIGDGPRSDEDPLDWTGLGLVVPLSTISTTGAGTGNYALDSEQLRDMPDILPWTVLGYH
jgi:hypothetical protein